MFTKTNYSNPVRIILALVLLAGVIGATPARASADVNQVPSSAGFINADGTLKLDGNISASFRADSWDVQLDPERGPIFSPKDREAFSPLADTTAGNWSALGSNLAGTDGALSDPACANRPIVNAIAVSGTNMFVGGCFLNAGGDPTADYAAKWDTITGTWSGLGNDGAPIPDGALKNSLRAIAVNGTDVYVGGVPTVWVGGAPAAQAKYLAKWNGTTWSWLSDDGAGGSSFSSLVTAITISGNNIYVGGTFTDVKNGSTTLTEADYIAKWDGTNWSALGNNGAGNGALSGLGGVDVEAIATIGSYIYVGGKFNQVNNGNTIVPDATYIAKWDGTNWSALGSRGGLIGSFGPIAGAVNAITAYGTDLYVAGQFTNVTQNGVVLTAADHLAKWDGSYWSALGSNGNGDGALNASMTSILVNGSTVYVAGGFADVNNNGVQLPAADYVAKWDGTNWSALGSNGSGGGALNTYTYALGLLGDELFVGGEFTNVNNNGTVLNTADYIASYNIGDGVDLYRVTTNGLTTPTCGTDWSTPCNLQYALTSLVSAGDEVWVAVGTYKPTSTTDRKISFTLMNGVAIYGGFAGTETLRTQRDPSTNVTILSGEIGAAGIIDNSYHVVVGSEIDHTAVLDGFTITAGNGDDDDFNRWYCVGGGMFLSYASPALSNLVFSDNRSLNGGGLFNLFSSPTLKHMIFNSNTGVLAGAVYNYRSNPTIMDATIDGNSTSSISTYSGGFGGGMVNDYSNPTLTNVTFSNNTASGVSGGGMYNRSSSPTLTNVTFSSNSAFWQGGGMYNDNSNPILTNVTFSGNSITKIPAPFNGGGIYNYNNSSPTLKNVIIANSPTGGDCVNVSSTLNAASTNNLIEDAAYACGLSNGVNGNIIGSDPNLGLLANNGGFTKTHALLAGSLAIDAGNDGACPSTDQRGVTRPKGSHCDMGAYEYEPVIRYVKWNASGANNGTSWANAYTDLQSALSAASSGDEIWVAAGKYKPTAGIDRTVSFTLKNGVAIYGGFAGTETLRTQRNFTTNVITLSGEIGVVGTSDNSYHVVIGSSLSNTTVLDGFTITAGNANGTDANNGAGGGLYNINGRPSLSNLIFSGNSAGSGGGIYYENSYNGNNFNITNVTFKDNSASGYGGGIYIQQGSVNIANSLFSGNAAQVGGGIYNQPFGSITIIGNNFLTNTASDSGGGIYNYGAIAITNSTFFENSVNGLGGGVYNYGTATITNSTYFGNAAAGNGGGVYNAGVLTIVSSTFSDNLASSGGGILSFNVLNLYNTIIANSISGDDCLTYIGTTVYGKNNLIMGTGNACSLTNGMNGNIIGVDPNLGPLQDNSGLTQTMSLGAGSPAIDAGNDATCAATDQRGVTRPQGSQCDIGAYEYQDNVSPTVSSITRVGASPTSAASVNFTVTFSESVTGVNIAPLSDFTLTTTGVTGASITGMSGSGATYTVTVNTGSGNGTVRLNVVDDDSIKDVANNPLGGVGTGNGNYTSGEVYTVTKITNFMAADFNGDGKTDVAVFRPSNSTWYIQGQGAFVYGQAGDIPVPADYNGDGKDDIAVFRPSNSTWYINGQSSFTYGTAGDIPVVADYNGDGKADIAVFRPTNSTWYILGVGPFVYGTVGDIPVIADYNGDGKADIAVFRPTNSTWYIYGVGPFVYGTVGDIPVVADYNGDGKADVAVFRPTNSTWYIYGIGPRVYGTVGDIPAIGDYDGDGKADITVFRPSNSTWYKYGVGPSVFGTVGDIPV